jgi:hypothetical protein
MAWVLLTLIHCVPTVVRMQHFVRRTTYLSFLLVWGDVRREFMQSHFAALHGILGLYLSDAL